MFGIEGKISTSVLSPNTTYTIYLVCHSLKYVLINNFDEPVEVSIAIDGVESRGVNKPNFSVELEPSLAVFDSARLGSFTPLVESIKHIVYLNPRKMKSEGDNDLRYPQQRKDDRFEVQLGEYFNKGGQEVNLEITLTEVKSGKLKSGPTMEGFEFRPKRTNAVS